MAYWLKVIGTSQWPLRDDWLNHAPSLRTHASFARRPGVGSFVDGDDFVYYALRGDLSRIVAIGKVLRAAVYEASHDPGWPWLAEVRLDSVVESIGSGFPLELLDVDRPLLKSVQRRSHVRLSQEEFSRAQALFGL